MDPNYFEIAARNARKTFGSRPSTPINKQTEASLISELIAFAALTAQRLLQNGEVERVQLDSLIAWAGAAHDWLLSSGYSSFARAGARREAEWLIDAKLSGLSLVKRVTEAETEIEEGR